MADTTGMADLRAENIERAVKGFALQEIKMKQLCAVMNSAAWSESYFQETAADLTGGTEHAVKGVPRLAAFPYGEVSWTKKTSYQIKHAIEGVISWEDAMSNYVDVIARTLLRISRAVARSIDTSIYQVMTENDTPSLINTVAVAGGSEWDSDTVANRDPIKNILDAIKEIQIDNYNPLNGSGYLVLPPKSYTNLISNAKVMQNPTFKAADVVANGVVGQICGLKIIVSNVVTADKAVVVIAKEALTYKELQPLTVQTIVDPLIKYTIRASEIGITQLVNPQAVCLITNTDK